VNCQRIELCCDLQHSAVVAPRLGTQLLVEHGPQLGRLLYVAYKDTVDDEGETLEQSTIEACETLDGKYGPLLEQASFAVFADELMISACVVVERNGPFIAFVLTDPNHQRKGLAKALILQCMKVLFDEKRQNVRLVVTAANKHAVKLYESLGFVRKEQVQ
jgi:ribosomal protein S18 acetylase RimI-like enzyme